MMEEIDEFLQFLLDHSQDDRIEITKKMKYGYRYYYVSFEIDSEPEENLNKTFSSRSSGSVEISIDNRNKCIEVLKNNYNQLVFENEDLVNKWSDLLEQYINKDNNKQIKGILEKTLSKCHNKNLYREYQMKKILPEDESL